MGQMTPTAFRIPLYPVKAIIPIGVFLLLLAVVNHVLKNIIIMIDDDNDLKLFEKDRG
jgi:TRAP-type mannitol/chloroaromatic compound transport system permease small subunit